MYVASSKRTSTGTFPGLICLLCQLRLFKNKMLKKKKKEGGDKTLQVKVLDESLTALLLVQGPTG